METRTVLRLALTIPLASSAAPPLPIIIDTDIGDDFDDSWALAAAVSRPDLWDLKLVLTAAKDTRKRAQIVAKYLTLYNRTDVPIGIGVRTTPGRFPPMSLYPWAQDADLDAYAKAGGTVHEDGVAAAAGLLMSAHPPTIIAIAPEPNFAALLARFPAAAARVPRIVAMFGGVDFCYGHKPIAAAGCPEYNVEENASAARCAARGLPLSS